MGVADRVDGCGCCSGIRPWMGSVTLASGVPGDGGGAGSRRGWRPPQERAVTARDVEPDPTALQLVGVGWDIPADDRERGLGSFEEA